MGNVPPADFERISRSSAMRKFYDAVKAARTGLTTAHANSASNPGDDEVTYELIRANATLERAESTLREEVDFHYRCELVDAMEMRDGGGYGFKGMTVSGPWGDRMYNLEGPAGNDLAGYLGVVRGSLRNQRELTHADMSFGSSRAALDAAAAETTWGKTGAWIAQVLTERHRRDETGRSSAGRRSTSSGVGVASWAPPQIDLTDYRFEHLIRLVDAAPGCPRALCGAALWPMSLPTPRLNGAYCPRHAQVFWVSQGANGGGVEFEALQYSCPGCGALYETPARGTAPACRRCGVTPLVSRKSGASAYADAKQQKKDSGTGLFANKKRAAQLAAWRQEEGDRVARARADLNERWAAWEADFVAAVERLATEDPNGWSFYGSGYRSLTRWSFDYPLD